MMSGHWSFCLLVVSSFVHYTSYLSLINDVQDGNVAIKNAVILWTDPTAMNVNDRQWRMTVLFIVRLMIISSSLSLKIKAAFICVRSIEIITTNNNWDQGTWLLVLPRPFMRGGGSAPPQQKGKWQDYITVCCIRKVSWSLSLCLFNCISPQPQVQPHTLPLCSNSLFQFGKRPDDGHANSYAMERTRTGGPTKT